jgi:predicted MFS family arabinose efflux permease
MLGALGASGFGFGAVLFAAVDILPYGWRALYAVGFAPLLLLPWLARGIPETTRFLHERDARLATAAEAHGGPKGWFEPIVGLARTFPLRFLGITAAGALYAAGEISVFQFCGYFTMNFHGWEPWRFSAMVVAAGTVGIFGNSIAGRLSDQIGRRPIGLGITMVFPFVAWLFYHVPGYALPVFWALLTVCSVSANVVIRSLGTESFPTSHRGTAGGWLTLVQTAGTVSGLAVVGVGTGQGVALPSMVGLLASLTILAGFALLLLPETSRLELEDISGTERAERLDHG